MYRVFNNVELTGLIAIFKTEEIGINTFSFVSRNDMSMKI